MAESTDDGQHADATVAAFATLSTPEISDALDTLGLPGSAPGIGPIANGQRMAGRAFTIRYVPVDLVAGTVGDYIDDVSPGSVLVLDNTGRTDCTVWGNILTEVATRRGIAGTVINGVCRDTPVIRALKYPLFSRGRFMRTGKDRVQVSDMEVPISLGDVLVRPGDIVVGDDDGIVVVPRDREDEVLKTAKQIAGVEDQIVNAVRVGARLDETRTMLQYHSLQRADKNR